MAAHQSKAYEELRQRVAKAIDDPPDVVARREGDWGWREWQADAVLVVLGLDDPDAAVERAARALADEYNYGWVFERDHSEPYDADYWRHTARKVLDAARRT